MTILRLHSWARMLRVVAAFSMLASSAAFAEGPAPIGGVVSSPTPFVLSAAGDGQGVRLGFDGTLQFTPAQPRRAGELAATGPGTPSRAGLEFGAAQALGESGIANATFAMLRGRFDIGRDRLWLGLGTRLASGGDPNHARLNLGAGWEPHVAGVAIEFAAFATPVSVEGGIIRPVYHIGGSLYPDSVIYGDSLRGPSHEAVWSSGQATLSWRLGAAEFGAVAGVTVGAFTAPQRWAQARVRCQLTQRLALALATGRTTPIALSLDPRTAPRTQLGIEFSPVAHASRSPYAVVRLEARRFSAVSLHDGRVAIHLACRDARVIELRGDLTDWQPVAMQRIGGGWWELVLAAEPGVHSVQIRLDGGSWEVPPGLPASAAENQGLAGTIVIL